jgi:hypothetical protein
MPWVEIYAVFVVSHLVGDYLIQTDWQAMNKRGGLRGTREMRRALFSHVTTYTLTFVPALIWLSDSLSVWACVGLAFVIFIPHLIQDDGSLLAAYARAVKKADIGANPSLGAAMDQSFHFLVLFLTALLASK